MIIFYKLTQTNSVIICVFIAKVYFSWPARLEWFIVIDTDASLVSGGKYVENMVYNMNIMQIPTVLETQKSEFVPADLSSSINCHCDTPLWIQ